MAAAIKVAGRKCQRVSAFHAAASPQNLPSPPSQDNTPMRIISGVVAGLCIVGLAAVFLVSPALACEAMIASWYGTESGNRTANGEHFDGTSLTAAHKTLPFGTRLRVTYRGKSVVVRINDRGPYIKGRHLDLSRAAAARIGLIQAGHGRVCITRL